MISIVLPVYNCLTELGDGLPRLAGLLKQCGYDYEIIVVDDCSVEGEAIKAATLLWNGVYIRNEKNEGKGYTVQRGVMNAAGDIIICMDGDFPFDLQVIPLLVDTLCSGNIQVAIGDRTLPQSTYPGNLSFLRRAGSFIISSIAGRLFTRGFYDTQCGIKGYKGLIAKDIFSRVTEKGFSFDLEVLTLVKSKKIPVARIPVTVNVQNGSTVRVVKDGVAMFGAFFRIYFNKLSGKYK